jgi:prevent-host-death family protein
MVENSVGATEFKAHCLALLDQVAQDRVPIIVTKHGRPVARVIPYVEDGGRAFGLLAGTVQAGDDLVAPIGEDWEADG